MSYRAGSQGLAALCGIPNGGPRIICDGCGLVYPIGERRPPPQWFFDGKPPPGWTQTRHEQSDEAKRKDYCPLCKPLVLPSLAYTNPEGQWVDSWFSARTTQDGDLSTITFHCNVCRGKVSTPAPVVDLGKVTKQFEREHAACRPAKVKKGRKRC